MGRIGKYAFLNAKVRAMRSVLMTESVYQRLMEAPSLQEFLHFLSDTQYQHLADSGKFKETAEIERHLIYEEVRRIRKIQKYSEGDVKQYISLFLDRYEAERLKALLRSWHGKEPGNEWLRRKIVFDMPVDAILSATRMSEIVALLEGTPFQKALAGVADVYAEEKSVFPLELAVDRSVFDRLWTAVKTFGREDRKIAGRLLGLEVDLKNLEWLGRFQTYYHIPPARVVDFLLPHGYRLHVRRLREIAADGAVEGALREVVRGSRVRLSEVGEAGALESLEGFLMHVLFFEARSAFGKFPFSISSVAGYMILLRIESRNIRMLLQAKAYGLSSGETAPLLVI